MDLRQKVYLLDEYLLDPGPFLGARPPTSSNVYLKFRGMHKNLQEESGSISSTREAVRLTAREVCTWWQSTGIVLKSEREIITMIEKLHKRWTVLFKQRKKETEQQKNNRDAFLAEMKQCFWPVCSKYEKVLATSKELRNIEDYQFLQKLKEGKPTSLGGVDKTYQKTINRRLQYQKQHQQSTSMGNAPSTSRAVDEVEDTIVPSNRTNEDPDFLINARRKSNLNNKKDLLSHPGICLVADKHNMSHRALTELLGEVQKAQNDDIGSSTLSLMSTKRKRDTTRASLGTKFLNHNLEKLNGRGILHWDGKIFK